MSKKFGVRIIYRKIWYFLKAYKTRTGCYKKSASTDGDMKYVRQVKNIPTNWLWSIAYNPTTTNMVVEYSYFYNEASQNADHTPDYLLSEARD
jgi:hypothetical protein